MPRKSSKLKWFKPIPQDVLRKNNVKYSMSRGWYKTTDDDWDKEPKPSDKRRIRLADGTYTDVYDNGIKTYKISKGAITEDFIRFGQMQNDGDIADLIDHSEFDFEIDGCGHIAHLAYSNANMLMKVDFQEQTDIVNGKERTWGAPATVYYMQVPSTVFGELYWLAESKVTQASPVTGEQRHALGIKFWDLVRVRGTVHDGRFPFTYGEVKAATVSSKSGKHISSVKKDVAADKHFAAKPKKGRTDRDEEIMSWYGNKGAANEGLDKLFFRTSHNGQTIAAYNRLETLTDKYNFLIDKGIIEED